MLEAVAFDMDCRVEDMEGGSNLLSYLCEEEIPAVFIKKHNIADGQEKADMAYYEEFERLGINRENVIVVTDSKEHANAACFGIQTVFVSDIDVNNVSAAVVIRPDLYGVKEWIRLRQQMDFILEADKEKTIFRQTYISDASRKENDAEHAWHMALMAYLLAEYSNEKLDLAKVMAMTLIHDLVEIDAGDTYAYDAAGNETKKERENAAAERIFGLLPKEQKKKLWLLWEEFEDMSTPEAKFANTLDKIQPLMLNDASKGKSWLEHKVQKNQVMKRNERTHEGSEILWEYARFLIEKNVEKLRGL